MATGVIYLDVDDEITSAAARIRSSAESRVAVVLPYGSRLATSRINFRLLARDALTHEKRLSIVAGDAATRALAASAGLPVFGSVAEYEGSLEGPADAGPTADAGSAAASAASGAGSRRSTLDTDTGSLTRELAPPVRGGPARTAPPSRPRSATASVDAGRRRRAPIFLGLAVLVLAAVVGGVAAFLLLPSASISVAAREESIGPLAISVAARTDATDVDVEAAVVPAQTIPIDVEASDTFPATGVRVQLTKARTTVSFLSKDFTAPNTIAAGSIVRTRDNVRFRTDATIRLPPATLNGLEITPSTATVRATAVDPGPDGNVPADTITTLPKGENLLFLEVTNPKAAAGGKRQEFQRVTQEDVDGAVVALTNSLNEAFRARVADPGLTGGGPTIFPATAQPGEPVIAVDPAEIVGTEVGSFDLAASLSGTVLAVDPAPIRQIGEARLRDAVRPGFLLVPDSSLVSAEDAVVVGQSVSFPVVVSARQVAVLDPAEIRNAILGQPLDVARATLSRYGPAEVTVWPDWVTTIPTMESRVEVMVTGPTAGTDGPSTASPSSAASPSSGASPSATASPSPSGP